MTPCSGQLTRGASASRNARIRPRSRVRHRRRPAPWSYPEQRFPQRPHRRLVALRGRTDITTACSASSNSTSSKTTFTNPSSPAHNLAERTPFPSPLDSSLQTAGTVRGERRAARRAPSGAHGRVTSCLLYTSDAADEEDSVDLGGRRIIKKKKGMRPQSSLLYTYDAAEEEA